MLMLTNQANIGLGLCLQGKTHTIVCFGVLRKGNSGWR